MMNAESVCRHTVAAFRQKWIDAVRDTLSEYHSILMLAPDVVVISAEDWRRLTGLKTKLNLLLNPKEEGSRRLLLLLSEMRDCQNWAERADLSTKLSTIAQEILKTEWVRIKDELEVRKPSAG
jgi:hypothetical protein